MISQINSVFYGRLTCCDGSFDRHAFARDAEYRKSARARRPANLPRSASMTQSPPGTLIRLGWENGNSWSCTAPPAGTTYVRKLGSRRYRAKRRPSQQGQRDGPKIWTIDLLYGEREGRRQPGGGILLPNCNQRRCDGIAIFLKQHDPEKSAAFLDHPPISFDRHRRGPHARRAKPCKNRGSAPAPSRTQSAGSAA